MDLKRILLLVSFLIFITFFIRFSEIFTSKSKEFIVTECSYDAIYVFPEKIDSLNVSIIRDSLFIFARGNNFCKRNISSSIKNIIVISEIGNRNYISSNLKLECKNKTIYNISVECCDNRDCLNNAKCINYICEYRSVGQNRYIYIYPIFYYNPQIPRCIGSELNYNELVGEDVGEFCYNIEKREIDLLEARSCVWVDGIRNMNLYGNGDYEIILKDYYNITKLVLSGRVSDTKTEIINDESIRYLCLSSLLGNLNKIEISTFRYKIFQKKEE